MPYYATGDTVTTLYTTHAAAATKFTLNSNFPPGWTQWSMGAVTQIFSYKIIIFKLPVLQIQLAG